jgi:hypothetical protein
MTQPPPDNLKQWSKNDLIRELHRLRAIIHEHAERRGDDPREQATTGAVTDVAGDPHARGGAIIDARSAVLLDTTDVVLVDTKQDEPVTMLLALGGRINYSSDRIEHAYLFGPDGAAALVSELIGIATRAASSGLDHSRRFAEDFKIDLGRRMDAMP